MVDKVNFHQVEPNRVLLMCYVYMGIYLALRCRNYRGKAIHAPKRTFRTYLATYLMILKIENYSNVRTKFRIFDPKFCIIIIKFLVVNENAENR